MPRAPLHDQGVTSFVMVSRTMSVGVTPLSSLVRTHAPVLNPPSAAVVPSASGSVQVAVSPCWEEDFPDVVLRIFLYVLGPLPRRLVECIDPFLPPRHRPSPREDRVGAPRYPYSDFHTAPFFEAAVIHSCSGPQICSPPRSLLPLRTRPYGSCGFSVRASRGSLPPHAPDMLAVRIGQLTAEDFHFIRCAALSAAPPTLALSRARKPRRLVRRHPRRSPTRPRVARRGAVGPRRSRSRFHSCWAGS